MYWYKIVCFTGFGRKSEGDELTATISIDGEVEATATGQYDSDNEEIAVVVETDSPDPN